MATATRPAPTPTVPVVDRLDSQPEADDFVSPAGDVLFEVIDGIVVEMPPMGSQEFDLANLLVESMILHATPKGLGRAFVEPLFRLEKGSKNRRRPDAAFVSAARWPVGKRVPPGNSWEMVPDLAVEVVSPSDLAGDLNRKIAEYFGAGVIAVWVIYPETRQIYAYSSPTEVRILTPPGELDGGAVLPGFRLPLARLFDDDPAPTQP